MGFEDLKNAVVIQAVRDYERMLVICHNRKIYNPETYYQSHWHRKNCVGGDSITTIILHGLDAKSFLNNRERLSMFTEIDGDVLLRAAQVNANAKCANHIVKEE